MTHPEPDVSRETRLPALGYELWLAETYSNPGANAIRLMESWAICHSQRDKIICQAYAAGIPIARIVAIMEISRKTVYRVLQKKQAGFT